jgi:hypothetical protein
MSWFDILLLIGLVAWLSFLVSLKDEAKDKTTGKRKGYPEASEHNYDDRGGDGGA